MLDIPILAGHIRSRVHGLPASAMTELERIAELAISDADAASVALSQWIAALAATGDGDKQVLSLLREMQEQITSLDTKVGALVAAQDDVNAAAAALTSAASTLETVAGDLQTAQANIQAEIAALQAANPAVDTTALNAAVAGLSQPLADLQAADTAVDALETPPPAPSA